MAAEISSSDNGAQNNPVPEKRPPMPDELYSALMSEDKEAYIKQYLGLSKEVKVQVGESDPTTQQTEPKDQNIEFNIQSATESGDTVLHLLVQNGYDELALQVLRQECSLLKAQNNESETPLHIAARTGNNKIFDELNKEPKLNPEFVKEALQKTNTNEETALHIVARHDNTKAGLQLMKLDPQLTKMVNKEKLSPLFLAIDNRCTEMVQTMLQHDADLVRTQGRDGVYPIHAAASKGNVDLVNYILKKYKEPNYATWLAHGKNLFHFAAQANQAELFELSQYPIENEKKLKEMNRKADNEGNTPLHIAAQRGHRLTMSAICKNNLNHGIQRTKNLQGFTPLQLSAKQVMDSRKPDEIQDIKGKIDKYISRYGNEFTSGWFEDIMAPSDNSKWERTQVIGLGAVLITTVTFAAAFTIPGGYDQNDGTPILGRTIAYKLFTVANTISFALAFTSLYTLVSSALVDPDYAHLKDATDTFTASAGFMVLAFALGSYVMLVPVNFPIAVIILIVTVPLGSPFMSLAVKFYRSIYKNVFKSIQQMSQWIKWMLEWILERAEWITLVIQIIFMLSTPFLLYASFYAIIKYSP